MNKINLKTKQSNKKTPPNNANKNVKNKPQKTTITSTQIPISILYNWKLWKLSRMRLANNDIEIEIELTHSLNYLITIICYEKYPQSFMIHLEATASLWHCVPTAIK